MIPIIAAIIAIGGVGITAYVSLQQVRKNHIIAARIKWLENLKTLVANFITDGYEIARHLKAKNIDGAFAKRINMEKWLTLIKLELNDTEELSKNLIAKLQEFLNFSDSLVDTKSWSEEKFDELDDINLKIQEIASCILKLEWEVSKSGDIVYKNEEQRKKLRLEYEERFKTDGKDK